MMFMASGATSMNHRLWICVQVEALQSGSTVRRIFCLLPDFAASFGKRVLSLGTLQLTRHTELAAEARADSTSLVGFDNDDP